MNVKIRRYFHGPMKLIYGAPEAPEHPRLVVECEVTSPPSSEGRTVYLWLNDEEVTALLLELRSAAVVARR